MGIRVTLGWDFDGGGYPNPTGGDGATLGHLVAGPAGFLNFLGRRVGLGRVPMPEPVRIGAYLKRLVRAHTPGCFYERSFEADRWSTAKHLLGWRDELYLSGWDGTMPRMASERLRTLAHVETLTDITLGPCAGEVLQELFAALPSLKIDDLSDVLIAEPRSLWPPLWQHLLQMIEKKGITIAEAPLPPAAQAGDLACFQRYLIDRSPAVFNSDGSLVVIEADSTIEAAEVLADWLAAPPEENARIAIIRGPGSALVDSRLHGLGLPQVGIGRRSPWRAALQVLPLALELHWDPLDPQRLLEFLSLPQGPIPRSAARRLARALQEHPGIGGDLWNRALEDARQIRERRLREAGYDGARLTTALRKFRDSLDVWLPATRYQTGRGMPVAVAREICARVAQWTALAADPDQDELMRVAGGQAMMLDRVLQACGLTDVSRPVLNRMLDAVIGDGLSIPRFQTEAAPWSVVDRPGQIYGRAETLIWFGFAAGDGPGRHAPWTQDERKCLTGMGIRLDERQTRRTRERYGWLRAMLSAQNRLLLISPRAANEEAPSRHPLFDELCAAFPVVHGAPPFVQDLISLRSSAETSLAGRLMRRAPVERRVMPGPRLIWSLTPGLPTPERESPTGIEALIGCSLRWLLRHYAGIAVGRSLALPSEQQMLGTLCHSVVEQLYRERRDWTPHGAGARAAAIYEDLLPRMAAPLLLPGRELERQRMAARVQAAVERLVENLAVARLSVEGVEVPVEKAFEDGAPTIRGKIDMVLRHEGGRPVILDMKWSLSGKRRQEALREGRSIQLAAYAWLLTNEPTPRPAAGYYMLRQARLLFAEEWPAPDHHIQGTELGSVWTQAAAAYRAGVASFRDGQVIATGVGDGPALEHQLPFVVPPPCHYCEYQPLCQANLDEP